MQKPRPCLKTRSSPAVRLKKKLGEDHYELLNYLIQEALWSDFNRSRPEGEQIQELGRFRLYARDFYKMSRGRLSVRQIAHRLSSKLGMCEKESMRFAAFLSYMLAQMGVIRSAREEASVEVGERHIADREEIPQRLSPSGCSK